MEGVIGAYRPSPPDWQDTFISKIVLERNESTTNEHAAAHWKISFKCVDHPVPGPTKQLKERSDPRRICTVTFDMEYHGRKEGQFAVDHVDKPWTDAASDIPFEGQLTIRDLIERIQRGHLDEYEFADGDGAGSDYWCAAVAWKANILVDVAKSIEKIHQDQYVEDYSFLNKEGPNTAKRGGVKLRRSPVPSRDYLFVSGKFTHYHDTDGKLPGFSLEEGRKEDIKSLAKQ